MIELYRLTNLNEYYAKVPITGGMTRAERNGAYGLSFSILQSYLKKQNILIDHNTIFKIDGLFYVSSDTSNSDTEKVEISINAELLQTQILMFKWIELVDLPHTNLATALTEILSNTIFIAGDCEDMGNFTFKLEKNNAQYALSELIKQTGTEVVYEGLTIKLRRTNWTSNSVTLRKGYDFTTLQESTDVSEVITRLVFKSTKGDLKGQIDSVYANKYSFIREGYQEFDVADISTLESQATEYLATVDKPKCSISISIPKMRQLTLGIGQTVKIHNTLLNEEMIYKVVGYIRSLTKEGDSYQLGERKKDFADIQEIITQEVQDIAPDIIVEVVEKEVITARTAHILNAWIRDLNVEYIETNFDALDTRKPAPIGNIRNCIRIQDECIDYVTQEVSRTEVVDYKNKDGQQIYYTAIKENPQAYKFFTLTEPTSIYPDLTVDQAEEFKVKVRKVLSESIKASFKFGETDNDTLYPIMVWGEGTDISGTSDNGKGFIFKGLDGLVLRYITSTGKKHEIKLGEKGIEGIPGSNIEGIEIPGLPITAISFYADGMVAEYGPLKKSLIWMEDGEGVLNGFYDISTHTPIPINWSEDYTPWE